MALNAFPSKRMAPIGTEMCRDASFRGWLVMVMAARTNARHVMPDESRREPESPMNARDGDAAGFRPAGISALWWVTEEWTSRSARSPGRRGHAWHHARRA